MQMTYSAKQSSMSTRSTLQLPIGLLIENLSLKFLKKHKVRTYTLMKLTLKEKLVIQTIFRESFHYLLVEETNVGEKISQMLFS